jgi:hypothetical protein
MIFEGSVHLLIPLYAVGVFTSFTLSQTGMVVRHLRLKERHWQVSIIINSLGAVMTAIALIIIGVTKFIHGAWMIIILIFLLVITFKKIHRHYELVARQLSIEKEEKAKFKKEQQLMLVPIPSLNKNTMHALNFAKSLSHKVIAVHISTDDDESKKLMEMWKRFEPNVELVMIESPYRKVLEPLAKYIDALETKNPKLNVVVVIPEFVPKHWWENLLHNQTGLAIKTMVHFRKRTHFINVQYHLDK